MSRDWNPEFARRWRLTAYHEAGHVIGTIAGELPLYSAAVRTVRGWWGRVSIDGAVEHSEHGIIGLEDDQLIDWIISAYAGLEAEAVFLQQHDSMSARAARQQAYKESLDGDLEWVRELISRPELADLTFDLEQAVETARRLVTAHWSAVDAVARALAEHGELFAPDLYRLAGVPARRAG